MQPWVIVAILATAGVLLASLSAILLQLALLGAAGYGLWWYFTERVTPDQVLYKVRLFVYKHL